MLSYWILKRNDGKPVGLVKTQNDRVTLHLTVPIFGAFTLFSKTDAVPIAPESEVQLCGAEALLGTDRGETICFAAKDRSASPARYLERLSQINTKKGEQTSKPAPPAPKPEQNQNSTIDTEKPPIVVEKAEEQYQINTIETEKSDSVTDTARETEAFSDLLNRAETFYASYEDMEDMVQKEDIERDEGINLFPQTFPGARWRYVDGADVLPHFEGTWTQPGGGTVRILAVRGRAAPRPPRTLVGFSRFLRDRDGLGYWIRIVPTGR